MQGQEEAGGPPKNDMGLDALGGGWGIFDSSGSPKRKSRKQCDERFDN